MDALPNVRRTELYATPRATGAMLLLSDGRVMFYDLTRSVCGISAYATQFSERAVLAMLANSAATWHHPTPDDWQVAGLFKEDLYRAAVMRTFDAGEQVMLRVLRGLR